MQFKNPEILYALLLLLIPIIVHLFQLRRFHKVPFTNVEFLKTVNIQTRKSQQLKKWLTLLTRLLLLASIIFAFAQPFTSENKGVNTQSETVIYLDNSFSMQAKGDKGELLKRALQDLISTVDDTEEITIFTNDNVFRNVTLKSIRNELIQTNYSNVQLDYDAVLLKGNKLFSNSKEIAKNLVLISDFQQNKKLPVVNDSLINTYWTQLKPVNTANVSIDSVYISKKTASNIDINVIVNQQGSSIENLPVSLYNDDVLTSKTSVNSTTSSEATFSLPANEIINGKITVEDAMLQFDNSLFFNINKREKINVLSINSSDSDFLDRIFSEDEFNFKSVAFNQLNYNEINTQNLIILNEIDTLPVALINAINAFVNNDGYVVIIPSEETNLSSYNQLLNGISNIVFQSYRPAEKKITTINYSHPLFNEVFDKKVSNFQYPKVNSYFDVLTNSGSVLQFEDGKPFLMQNGNTFVFTAALNIKNSNVINSPLIVPTLYNIGNQSFKLPKLYYSIGLENTFDINTSLQQDDILKLTTSDIEIIPQQRTLTNKVVLTTLETPSVAGIYKVINKNEELEKVSYNYNRNESVLIYHNLDDRSNINMVSSIPEVINSIKSASNINALWKWFVIFALIFLIIEMLILKYIR